MLAAINEVMMGRCGKGEIEIRSKLEGGDIRTRSDIREYTCKSNKKGEDKHA